MDFKDGIHIDGISTEVNALQNKLLFKNNLIAGCSGKFIIRATNPSFECDNDGAGSNNTPKTAATFSNVTAIGPLRGNLQATVDPKRLS